MNRIAVVVLGLALLLNSAFAHVGLDPKSAPSGEYAKLTFRVPHGCEGSPTVQLSVQIPEGVVSVKPQVHFGWKITTKSRKLSNPITLHGKPITSAISEVSWSGGSLPDEFMDEFGISLKLPEKASGPLYFPVVQTCKKGVSRWVEIPKEPATATNYPAPLLQLIQAPEKNSGHTH